MRKVWVLLGVLTVVSAVSFPFADALSAGCFTCKVTGTGDDGKPCSDCVDAYTLAGGFKSCLTTGCKCRTWGSHCDAGPGTPYIRFEPWVEALVTTNPCGSLSAYRISL